MNKVDLPAKTLVRLRWKERRNLGRLDSCCMTKIAIFRDLLSLIALSIQGLTRADESRRYEGSMLPKHLRQTTAVKLVLP
jgi:hypothetical protein